MLNARKHLQRFSLTAAIVGVCSLVIIGSSAFALPTAPTSSGSSGSKSGATTQSGQFINGIYFPAPQLSSHSSSWGSSYEEHVDENWYVYGGDNHDGDDHGGDDNSAPVPEPTTALLMSLGLAGSAYLKRRKSKISV